MEITRAELERRYNNTTVTDLTKELGISIRTFYRILNKKNIPLKGNGQCTLVVVDEVENAQPKRDTKSDDSKINRNWVKDIVNDWNIFATAHNLGKINVITEARKIAIFNRLGEKAFAFYEILQKISESQFLLGENKDGWKVTFDFVFRSKNNYVKILEGNYSNKNKTLSDLEDISQWINS